MTFVCLMAYMENISLATISMACSSRMNCSPSPGSAITRWHWRGMGTRPSVTPSAPRFFPFSSLGAFSPSLVFAAFFFAPGSSLRRSTTYSAPFSK